MTGIFTVPKAAADALAAMDAAGKPLDQYLVQGQLNTIANGLTDIAASEQRGLQAESLAFTFTGQNEKTSQWGIHYGPMFTGEDNHGNPICAPDINLVDPPLLQYWADRASAVSHPFLKARYADLAWDFAPAIGAKRNIETVRTAIDAYMAATAPRFCDGLHARLRTAVRAFDLAMQVKDTIRADASRKLLLALHGEATATKAPVWWIAPKRLLRDDRTGMNGAQRTALVQSLEDCVVAFADISKPDRFDPHDLERAADMLVKHYRRHGTEADLKRLHETVARGFEAAAGLADAMVAPSFFQSAINAYRAAGMKEDVSRGRILMEQAIHASNKAMKSVGTTIEIKREDIDTFVAGVVQDDPALTFAMIANSFVATKASLETEMQEIAKAAPLQAMLTKSIMRPDHVAATIGSVTDDTVGRLIEHASLKVSLDSVWLMNVLEAAIEKHEFTADHFTGWTNRLALFEDTTFLKEGFEAFLDEDYVKALHVLVPQAETGLRAIAVAAGMPATKARQMGGDTSVSINMGDILSNEKVLTLIGEDIALHLRTLYSDQRGMNLRNLVAHGLFAPRSLNPHVVRLVVQSLLVLGVWKDIVAARATPDA